jgi:hypothetical protein
VDTSYLAPASAPSDSEGEVAPIGDNYGAASQDEPAYEYSEDYDPNDVPIDQAAPLDNYGVDQAAYEPEGAAADDAAAGGEDMGLKMLMSSVPGVPGEDYPILADVPETAFSCDGQVAGGYYADSEAECQVFHICGQGAEDDLVKYSFLCPNGTIFNQNYFICDWWFNFDCAEADAIAVEKNNELAAAREEATAAAADTGAASNDDPSFAGAADNGYGAPADEAGVEADLAGYSSAGRR